MNVTAVREAIDVRLATIERLKHAPRVPDQIVVPCAFVGPPTLLERLDMAGGVRAVFPVFILVSEAAGSPRAQEKLDPYLDTSGPSSVVAAVEDDDDLGGTVDTIRWAGTEGYGGEYDVGAITYWGAIVNFETLGD